MTNGSLAGGAPKRGASRRLPWIALGVVAAAAALGGGWWAAGPRAEAGGPVERFSHVHGLDAPAWAGGDLLVATHHGLLRVLPDGRWRTVPGPAHDLMGFRAHPSRAGQVYGSGHPDLRSGLPNPLGLLRSDDRGRTWAPVSLQGTADFHVLTVQATDGEALLGFDATGMRLLRSLDGGRRWEHVSAEPLLAAGGVLALELDPTDPDILWAGTPRGLWASDDGGVSWSERDFGGLPVTALRASADGRWFAYVAHPELGLLVREPDAAGWRGLGLWVGDEDAVGHVAPHPTEPDALYAGTLGMSVFATRDGGATWQALAERGVPR
ncbi:MAG: hypothetical protein K0A98_03175 [Trueperaceae bacterium]|nr:hypothetical protein [Trueperaceae bacterium]